MFTIIMAAKDSERWIFQTIVSLINQTYEDWQCIISVNGSSDRTLEIAESLSDTRFSTIISGIPNKSLALNRAILKAKREWICILDTDDLWEKDKLEKQYKKLSSDLTIDVLGTQMLYINEDNIQHGVSPKLPLTHQEIVSWLFANSNSVANSSVCYRKDLHDRVGYYDPEMFGVEDYDMWKRCARNNIRFSNLDESLLLHRIHKNSNYNSGMRQKSTKALLDSIDHTHRQIRGLL